MHSVYTLQTMQRFILLQVITPHYHQDLALRNMWELEQLVETYGGAVVDKAIQHRVKPDSNTYIGKGKLAWLKEKVKAEKIEVVVFNEIVNSGQLFRLERALWEVNTSIKVWDRVDLILNIFEQHATTTEAKLQIQLARITHTGPRIYGLGKTELSRQGGGIGTRGLGETNIERERRLIKKQKQKIQEDLKQRANEQQQRILQRRKKGISTVALIGYTSAGKTSLFNALTSKTKQTNKALFTTLDSIVGKLKQGVPSKSILISDTIGFIDELPPLLIDAFRSTLMESVYAQVLLHVVDAADPALADKMKVVEVILEQLKIEQTPVVVFNKVDLLDAAARQHLSARYGHLPHTFVSAKTKVGIADLKLLISDRLVQADGLIPFA